jgi:hypothetical protein
LTVWFKRIVKLPWKVMWAGLKIERNSVNVSIRDFRKPDLDDLLHLLPVCDAEESKTSGSLPDHAWSIINRLYG